MTHRFTRGLILWSLLTPALACNAVLPLRLSAAPQAAAAAVAAPDPSYHVDMRQAVEFLASDELEGRMIGTPGIDRAADYIAGAFGKLGRARGIPQRFVWLRRGSFGFARR